MALDRVFVSLDMHCEQRCFQERISSLMTLQSRIIKSVLMLIDAVGESLVVITTSLR